MSVAEHSLFISADDAATLLQNKDVLPHRVLVSIQGKVTALSPLMRINKDIVFVAELEGGPIIIIKQPQFHKWYEKLAVGACYIFTNLRPTTLSKSFQPEQRVFIPWTKSKLVPWGGGTSILPQFTHTTLQDWLKKIGVSGIEPETLKQSCLHHDGGSHGLASYQGVVTSDKESSLGVYELDDSVKLYLCYLPKLNDPIVLKLLDAVAVHNVHEFADQETQEKHLFACVRTSISIQKVSQSDAKKTSPPESSSSPQQQTGIGFKPAQPGDIAKSKKSLSLIWSWSSSQKKESSPRVLPLLQWYTFPLSCVQSLLELYSHVDQVCGLQGHSEYRGKTRSAVKASVLSLLQHFCGELHARNFVMEFCRHKEFCPLYCNQTPENQRIPKLTLLSSLLKEAVMDSKASSTPGVLEGSSSCLDTDFTWEHEKHSVQDKKFLLGFLAVSAATGRLQLSDAQTAVDVVTVSASSSSSSQPHSCSHVCECSRICKADRAPVPFRCPKFHPCCRGHLVLVKKYTLVYEKFGTRDSVLSEKLGTSSTACESRQHRENQRKLTYVILSPEDCVVIHRNICEDLTKPLACAAEEATAHKRTRSSSESVENPSKKFKSPNLDFKTGERAETGTCKDLQQPESAKNMQPGATNLPYSRTESAKSMSVPGSDSKQHQGAASCSSVCQVYITSKQHLRTYTDGRTGKPVLQFCADGFLLSPESRSMEESTGSNKQGSEVASAHPNGKDSTDKPDDKFQLKQPVTLTFEGKGCEWFELIHPPGVYRFESGDGSTSVMDDDGASPFIWPQLDKRLERAMETSGTRISLSVSPSVLVCRVFHPVLTTFEGDAGVSSLTSALALSGSQLKSFRAVVVNRQHYHAQTPTQRQREFRTVGELWRASKSSGVTAGTGSHTIGGLLGQRNLRLLVRDVTDTSVSAVVEFHGAQLAYPLALLPGAVVNFHRLERKQQVNCSDKVFRFLQLSALELVCFQESLIHEAQTAVTKISTPSRQDASRPALDTARVLAQTPWRDTATQLFVNLWRQPRPLEFFAASCHICQFFRLSLKSLCARCGSVFEPSGCSAPACGNADSSQMLARISVLVEDGSGQVLVNVNKRSPPDVARKLLLITSEQWQHLEQAVQHQGELFLQQFGPRGGTAAEDLVSLLCDTHRVKRPCWLLMRKPPQFDRKPPQQAQPLLSAYDAVSMEGLVMRKINTGLTRIETHSLPYVIMDCVDIQEL